MLGKDFAAMVQDGIHPVVTFIKGIEDKEGYAEAGMRGRIAGVDNVHEFPRFYVDFSEFDEFNKQFEAHNYYDDKGVARLTAREAGHYKPQDTIYADGEYGVPWEIEQASRLALHERFKASGSGLSYVQWLEDALIN